MNLDEADEFVPDLLPYLDGKRRGLSGGFLNGSLALMRRLGSMHVDGEFVCTVLRCVAV